MKKLKEHVELENLLQDFVDGRESEEEDSLAMRILMYAAESLSAQAARFEHDLTYAEIENMAEKVDEVLYSGILSVDEMSAAIENILDYDNPESPLLAGLGRVEEALDRLLASMNEGISPNYKKPYPRQNERETFDDVKDGTADMYLQNGFDLNSTEYKYARNRK